MTPALEAKVKGGEPVSVRLRLDGDSIVEVAGVERDLLPGPFQALQVQFTEPAP